MRPKICKTSCIQKGLCNKPTKLQSILNTKKSMLSKHYESTEAESTEAKDVPDSLLHVIS